ncbi:MAG: hypothetical protein WCL00_05410 [Bacteroidota bacterium]
MKKQHLVSSVLLLCLLVFAFSSCTKTDPSPSPTDPRASFTGTWNVSENWTKLVFQVTISIDASSSTGVFIDNFADAGAGVKTFATVSGNTITIAGTPQTLSNGWIILSGSGSLTGTSRMNWGYVFTDQATQYTAVAIFTKN